MIFCVSLCKVINLLLLCGWPFISLSLFHSFFSLFFFFSLSILFHDWQRAFLVNQTIFHFISNSISSPTPSLLPPSNSPSFLFPSLFCCCAVSSLGWWSNQRSNQTWAQFVLKETYKRNIHVCSVELWPAALFANIYTVLNEPCHGIYFWTYKHRHCPMKTKSKNVRLHVCYAISEPSVSTEHISLIKDILLF